MARSTQPTENFKYHRISGQYKTVRPGATRRPPAATRSVQVKDCDDDDNIQAKDDQTLAGRIVVQNCACERRFANNATRLAAISATVAKQLQAYFQKLYNTAINYQVNVRVLSGNKTHTVFAYTVQVPKSEQSKVKNALKHTCKDEQVSHNDSVTLSTYCRNDHDSLEKLIYPTRNW